ncbi:hypothetical protein PA0522 [Candidatus Phytoplasma australiense]|uniref:Signal peptidase I n=1 Tax=Phytoplasma australiense TaxID=59748 RepID=B1VA83_PHYAS|nr:hypothetical protein PA0522 [Candidatus Phytoplasma australiense]
MTPIKKNTKNPLKFMKIKKIIVFIFLDIFLLYLFIVSLGRVFLKEKCPKYLGFSFFNVASGSMEPYIKGPPMGSNSEIGDTVFVRGVWDCKNLKAFKNNACGKEPAQKPFNNDPKNTEYNPNDGDIVVFKSTTKKDKIIIHRLIYNDTENKCLYTWGDNNDHQLSDEKKIPYENVVGKLMFKDRYFIPTINKLIEYFGNKPLYAVFAIIYLIVMFVLLGIIKKNWNQADE